MYTTSQIQQCQNTPTNNNTKHKHNINTNQQTNHHKINTTHNNNHHNITPTQKKNTCIDKLVKVCMLL